MPEDHLGVQTQLAPPCCEHDVTDRWVLELKAQYNLALERCEAERYEAEAALDRERQAWADERRLLLEALELQSRGTRLTWRAEADAPPATAESGRSRQEMERKLAEYEAQRQRLERSLRKERKFRAQEGSAIQRLLEGELSLRTMEQKYAQLQGQGAPVLAADFWETEGSTSLHPPYSPEGRAWGAGVAQPRRTTPLQREQCPPPEEKAPDEEGPHSPHVLSQSDEVRDSLRGLADRDAGHMSAVVRWLDTKLFHDGSVSASPEWTSTGSAQLDCTPESAPAETSTPKQDAECCDSGQMVPGVPPFGRCEHVGVVMQVPNLWSSAPPRTAYRHGGG